MGEGAGGAPRSSACAVHSPLSATSPAGRGRRASDNVASESGEGSSFFNFLHFCDCRAASVKGAVEEEALIRLASLATFSLGRRWRSASHRLLPPRQPNQPFRVAAFLAACFA